MLKLLLLLVVIAVAVWMVTARQRKPPASGRGKPDAKRSKQGNGGTSSAGERSPPAPLPMLACAHCGVHLPQADATFDAAGRPFCGDAHRLAGPR